MVSRLELGQVDDPLVYAECGGREGNVQSHRGRTWTRNISITHQTNVATWLNVMSFWKSVTDTRHHTHKYGLHYIVANYSTHLNLVKSTPLFRFAHSLCTISHSSHPPPPPKSHIPDSQSPPHTHTHARTHKLTHLTSLSVRFPLFLFPRFSWKRKATRSGLFPGAVANPPFSSYLLNSTLPPSASSFLWSVQFCINIHTSVLFFLQQRANFLPLLFFDSS